MKAKVERVRRYAKEIKKTLESSIEYGVQPPGRPDDTRSFSTMATG